MQRTNIKSTGFNILCLDPSLTNFGYAIVCKDKVMATGCISTKPTAKKMRIRKSDDRLNRVSEINETLKEAMELYPIKYIVSELPHGSQNAAASIALGLISGSVQGMADFLNIGLEWYSEADCKKALLGKISATKEETIIAIAKKYEVAWPGAKYKKEAIADALQVYYCANRNSATIRVMKNL